MPVTLPVIRLSGLGFPEPVGNVQQGGPLGRQPPARSPSATDLVSVPVGTSGFIVPSPGAKDCFRSPSRGGCLVSPKLSSALWAE